jgi:uncharacterized membrane protein SpoIIM required for sporulation
MKVAEIIERRQPMWLELEKLTELASTPMNRMSAEALARFAALYRGACADLALAEAYQLPPTTVDYLQQLVAQAHNQLYRTRKFQWRVWSKRIFEDTPRLIFHDPCVWITTAVFWGLFVASAFLAYDNHIWPGFAESVVGMEMLEGMEEMYKGFGDRPAGANPFMAGFYVKHNATIGLTCFVMMLFIIPGMITLAFNAVTLGAVFGYMYRPEMGDAGLNFKNFVTAHGPFELTAIILSASAGLRIGLGWLLTGGLNRSDSLVKSAREALPIAICAVILFCLAAAIEGFVSPNTEQQFPWWGKAVVAWLCSASLMIYFVVLGYPRGGPLDSSLTNGGRGET